MKMLCILCVSYIFLSLIPEESLGFTSTSSSFYRTFVSHNRRYATERPDGIEWPLSSPGLAEGEEERGDVLLPTTGISVSDEMEAAMKDRFVTEVVPIKGLRGVAQLVTSSVALGSFEPVRYLVALSPPPLKPLETGAEARTNDSEGGPSSSSTRTYAMVDTPPYSPQLVTRMKAFMGVDSKLATILITNRDSIHHDEAPSVFSTRRADLALWKEAFPDIQVVAYRLDIPRDCRESVTQVLDGYGPFALAEDGSSNVTFVETGRPLTYDEWDHDIAQDIISGRTPPDDTEGAVGEDTSDYSPEGIRAREDGKRVLAAYTPGHSFGSISYIFPEQGLCCSGYTIPVEETRAEDNFGMENTGPALDCRGYITTSRAGLKTQMGSAKALVNTYADRFKVVLPARGDPLFLDGSLEERKELLTEILEQYRRIGEVYEQLGITGDSDE
jgi:glyoxylase-like metal-dependent hydrolase (beta-lactamase superfamily II)